MHDRASSTRKTAMQLAHALLLGAALASCLAGCSGGVETTDTTPPDHKAPLGPLDPFAKAYPGAWLTAAAQGPEGDIHLAGAFEGSLDFGDGTLVAQPGAANPFLARLDSTSRLVWAGTPGLVWVEIASVAVGHGGQTIAVGGLHEPVDFGGGPLPGENDGFVAAFTAGGAPDMSFALGGPGIDATEHIALSPAGDIAVSLQLGTSADLGGGLPDPYVAGPHHAVAVLDAKGAHRWDRVIEDGGETLNEPGTPLSVAVAPDGAVYFAGSSKTGTKVGDASVAAGGFAGKLDANGALVWLVRSEAMFQTVKIAADSHGDLVIGGIYWQGASIFGEAVPPEEFGGDAFLAKLTSGGKATFVKSIGTEGNELSFTLSVGPDDTILVGETGYGGVSFGGETFEGIASDGSPIFNVCAARFSAAGDHEASMCWPAEEGGEAQLVHVSVDPKGQILLAGQVLYGALTIGEGVLDASDGDGFAAFVARTPL